MHKADCEEEECRQWSLILGAVILAFGLLPSFRSVRILNIIALVGTNYSCLFFLISAAKKGITHGIITRYTLSFCLPVCLSLPAPFRLPKKTSRHAQAPADIVSSAAHADDTRSQADTAVVQRCAQAGLASTDLQELTAMLVRSHPDQTDTHKLNGLIAAQTVAPHRKTAMLAIDDENELYRSDLNPLC